jgi:hypothetical protein
MEAYAEDDGIIELLNSSGEYEEEHEFEERCEEYQQQEEQYRHQEYQQQEYEEEEEDDEDEESNYGLREDGDGRVTDRFLRALRQDDSGRGGSGNNNNNDDDDYDNFSRSSSLSSSVAWSFGRDAGEMSGGTERGLSPPRRHQRPVDPDARRPGATRRRAPRGGGSASGREQQPASLAAWNSHECDAVHCRRDDNGSSRKEGSSDHRREKKSQRKIPVSWGASHRNCMVAYLGPIRVTAPSCFFHPSLWNSPWLSSNSNGSATVTRKASCHE